MAAEPPPGPRFGSFREHLPWALIAIAAVAAAGAWSQGLSRHEVVAGGRWWLGVLAALGYISAYVYAARKRLGFGRFRPVRPWYVAHAWLTAAGFVVGLHHAGFVLGGILEGSLLVGFGLAVLSGLALALIHHRFQRAMVGLEGEHLLPEDIVEALARRLHEIADLKAASRPEVARLIEAEVLAPLGRYLVRSRLRRGGRVALAAIQREREASLAGRLAELAPEERERVDRAPAAELARQSLQVQAGLHDFRSRGVTAHLVLSSAVLGLLLLHVAAVLYY
jgi:hypothetical protein